ncbi:hypothetical protein FO519_003699 [Halicephalobus sp. NKZ332]|nr:hypothetical protein FO519_003699 [Halicephalobus sp. NKZ332]
MKMTSFDSDQLESASRTLKVPDDLPITLDFPQTSATFSSLLLLANSYLNRANPKQHSGQSIDTDESSESPDNETEKEQVPTTSKRHSKEIPDNACTICRMEEATVSHFGVDVCTGCRAFFRRSVARQKTYRCLNSKLCGKNNKEQLYNQKLDSSKNTALVEVSQPTIPTMAAPSITVADSVLDHFLHFRRKITYERLQKYYKQPKDDDEFVDCMHTVELGLNETRLIVEILSRTPIFDDIPEQDKKFLFGDYSVVWTVQEQVFATIRNGGHLIKKMYHQDGTTVRLNEEVAFKHWKPIFHSIKDNRPVIFEMVGRFLLSLATYTTIELSKFMLDANMNDDEMAAFTALMFLRPEVLSQVTPETRRKLMARRQQLMRNLGSYLQSIGQKTAVRMLKHGIAIIRVTTTANSLLPESYFECFEEGARDISTLLNSALPMNFNEQQD